MKPIPLPIILFLNTDTNKPLLAQDLPTHNCVALREHVNGTHPTQLLYIFFLVQVHL